MAKKATAPVEEPEQEEEIVVDVSDDEDSDPGAGVETKLVIGKQRNGPTGDVNVVFQKRFVRFENGPLEQEPHEGGYTQ